MDKQLIDDLRKVNQFIDIADRLYVSGKRKGGVSMSQVKRALKEVGADQFFARWKKPTSYYSDDSIQIYYKKGD